MEAVRERLEGSVTRRVCPCCETPTSAVRCDGCGAVSEAGGYRILRLLSKGPHGRVYLAEDASGSPVALKELLFAQVPDAGHLQAFEREAQVLGMLDHPRIPRLLGSFREGEGVHTRLYLAQKFVSGESLAAAAGRRIDERAALEIARDVLEVLEAIHGRTPPIVHRDIKPANLIRDLEGKLWVVDFGAARDLERGVTHGATLVGTFGYMPPEQLGGTVDATCDLYALGSTLLHLLTGVAPGDMLNPDLELEFHPHAQLTPGVTRFFDKLVARKRTDRFPTARAALDAVNKLLAPTRSRSGLRWPSRAVVGGLIAAALLGVGASWVARSWAGWFGDVERTDPAITHPTSPNLIQK